MNKAQQVCNTRECSLERVIMKKKILVVDDDEGLRDLYKEELTEEGYEILIARNGKEGLQKVEKEKPDLIVLDIVMPKMDGMEALGRIIGKDKTIPIILHTSHPGYREDFMSWAADAYIMKSTDLTELKDEIKELLERRKPGSNVTQTAVEVGRMGVERKRTGKNSPNFRR
jgi:DNA-binding response OmpR family regulator